VRIGNLNIENPLFLGPMAGVTDWAFRSVCAELGAGITVTEMVSSRALVYQDKKSAALLKKNPGSICGAQIFGNDPAIMAQAAILALEISGCDFIDINMGCPMPKIANSGDGCGFIRLGAPSGPAFLHKIRRKNEKLFLHSTTDFGNGKNQSLVTGNPGEVDKIPVSAEGIILIRSLSGSKSGEKQSSRSIRHSLGEFSSVVLIKHSVHIVSFRFI